MACSKARPTRWAARRPIMYNSQREETEQIDPLGRITTYTYDAAGNQITVEDPMGRVTTSVYDAHAAR